ncbi:hypothetical protein KQH51_03420 [bacterium]|nr:hypothetical protein [bacterium]MCB2201972.1 hypothetical protein [bacterium]
MSEEKVHGPLTFEISKWYGYVLAAMFILYGGVKIILGFLDHTYEGIYGWVIFLLLGIIIVTIATAFRDQKRWGWGGMVGITALVILASAINLSQSLNWILLVIAMAVMVMLMAPPTKDYVAGRR